MKRVFLAAAMALASCAAFAQGEASADGAQVYFVNISDGDVVQSPVKVIFGLSGMGIAPAGTEKANTGHHHLLVNRPPMGAGEDGAEELEYGIPADDNHMHFGGGQTETTLDLPPGTHTLQLVLGDLNHVPHLAPVMSDVITITVQ